MEKNKDKKTMLGKRKEKIKRKKKRERKGCQKGKRFGFLVSLFNGISTFVGYLMPKLFSQKNSSCTI